MNFDLNHLPSRTRNLLDKLANQKFIKKFYLAGGTAVALFLNHRQSQDLDFFSEKEFNSAMLIKRLKKITKFRGIKSAEDTLISKLDDIKVSFFSLPYKLIESPLKYKNLTIATLVDLALMKILAISDRGTKRDFIDLYFLCQKVKTLEEFLYLFPKKFGRYNYNLYHIIKSLSYFKDAEQDEMPKMYTEIEWKKVEKFFKQEKPKLAKKFIGLQ